jgi:hypothetical protein
MKSSKTKIIEKKKKLNISTKSSKTKIIKKSNRN